MLLKTHLAFAVIAIILLLQSVNNKIIFVAMVLIATALPDADTAFSAAGKNIFAKILRFFVKHRGIVHSLTIGILISILFTIYLPVVSLGFFVGWSVHMLCDSFTKEGVRAFWPFKFRSCGPLVTGGKVEESLFLGMIFLDLILFLILIVW